MSARSSDLGLTMGSVRAEPRSAALAMAMMRPIADAYLLWRLFKEALRRITGVPTDASFLTTLFAVGVLANALRQLVAPSLKRVRPTPPSFASIVMAGAVVREIPGSIGGDQTRGKPFAGTLITISLVAPVRRVLRLITAPVLRVPAALAAFVKRYGL
jgi:hypothetical protein